VLPVSVSNLFQKDLMNYEELSMTFLLSQPRGQADCREPRSSRKGAHLQLKVSIDGLRPVVIPNTAGIMIPNTAEI